MGSRVHCLLLRSASLPTQAAPRAGGSSWWGRGTREREAGKTRGFDGPASCSSVNSSQFRPLTSDLVTCQRVTLLVLAISGDLAGEGWEGVEGVCRGVGGVRSYKMLAGRWIVRTSVAATHPPTRTATREREVGTGV